MRRGILAVPEGDVGSISTVENYTRTEKGRSGELTIALRVKEEQTLSGETSYYYGEGLLEREEEATEYRPEESQIRSRTEHSKIQEYTTFVAVPESETHRGFMLVSSSTGTFAFGLVSSQNPACRLQRADLHLGSFYEQHESFTPETSGGHAMGDEHGTSKMTAWGEDVLSDTQTAQLLSSSIRHDQLNQLAGNYLYEAEDGTALPYSVNLAASGYVEIWDPSDLPTREFLQWVEKEILPFANAEPDDDETEQAELTDDEQDHAEAAATDGGDDDVAE